jgi:Holliday junction resolvase RusA-like endonuclease
MKTLKLISPLPPSVNSYLHYRVASAGKKKFVQAYPTEETTIYKNFFSDYVKDQMREQNWIRPEKGKLVFVRIIFYLDRKRKDPNNLLKVPFDVLTEANAYIDDDIALPIVDRVYIDKANPRMEIEITESSYIGIFDSKEDLEEFKNKNCSQCKKDPEHCSIFKKILENRMIEEVDLNNKECFGMK